VGGLKALAVELKVRLPSPGLRSDADIARAVDNVITWTTALPPDTVHVMVENGWITLTGTVDWHAQRELVADSVRHLGGVTGLSNQLGIKARVSAMGVQADIEAALKRRASSEAQAIAVTVHGGAVTLTGTVHNTSERQLATHAAWGAAGVASVIDQLTLVE
jgi:osmotically-inducible protein OsmY